MERLFDDVIHYFFHNSFWACLSKLIIHLNFQFYNHQTFISKIIFINKKLFHCWSTRSKNLFFFLNFTVSTRNVKIINFKKSGIKLCELSIEDMFFRKSMIHLFFQRENYNVWRKKCLVFLDGTIFKNYQAYFVFLSHSILEQASQRSFG